MGEEGINEVDSCYSAASVAGAVIGTLLTTILLLGAAALVYRQWRRNKENKDELEKLIVDDSGEIINEDVPIFTEEVHEERRNQQAAKKSEKIARSAASRKLESDIAEESSIFESTELSVGWHDPQSTPKPRPDPQVPSLEMLTLTQSSSASSDAGLGSSAVEYRTTDASTAIPHAIPVADPSSRTSRIQRFKKVMDDLTAIATDENINFLEAVVQALKISYEPQERKIAHELDPVLPFKLPDSYRTPGKGKVAIDDGIDFYLNEVLKSNIEKKAYEYDNISRSLKKSWQLIVRQCLVQVYGKNLAQHSAKGAKGGCRPRIDTNLYIALWRKHLVLVTNPEIVEDAYAFDNPCFKDATPAVTRNHESRPLSTASLVDETPAKDSARWSSPWSSLGLPSVNKNDKRRTLDDSCLGPKATRVSIVSLRSRDFTGLGFNVCGNMREGIFVKDLLHRGPASESGRINPGDRIGSVKISFRSMVYEDALTILSYASPYDVELEVETGGSGAGSRPTTLLKKSVGPSPSRICHPLYRSQSIPELSQAHKTSAKRLFIADPNESMSSNYSTMNSTMKSSKSTPGSQTLERRHEEAKSHHNHHNHHKFGIKVLPALDGTVHRIENQNEHNTNLERRHSRKLDAIGGGSRDSKSEDESATVVDGGAQREIQSERYQKRENPRQQETRYSNNVPTSGADTKPSKLTSNGSEFPERTSVAEVRADAVETINIPSEVPAEVHNAAMAARRNRKNSMELLNSPKPIFPENGEPFDAKSPQKNKRKAPAPPKATNGEGDTPRNPKKDLSSPNKQERENPDDSIESIADYTESLNDYVTKVREITMEEDAAVRRQRLENNSANRRNSESDSDADSEVHNSFTTIELKPADITIHHTPVPRVDGEADDENDDDDSYRKAASLGDLSKYENKGLATLERAQSLDMADTGSKKRKIVPLPPEDMNESTEDLTKLDHMDSFDRRKLKKSSEWGTLEDAIWNKKENEETDKSRTRKRSNGTLERSKSAVEIKLKEASRSGKHTEDGRLVPVEMPEDTSIELYNLPLSKRLTREFINSEKMFNHDRDNALARIVNNGRIVKSPTPEEVELDFRQAKPFNEDSDENEEKLEKRESANLSASPSNDEFGMALRYFDLQIGRSPNRNKRNVVNLERDSTESLGKEGSSTRNSQTSEESLYAGRKEAQEEPVRKVTVVTGCPGCDRKFSHHDHTCAKVPDKSENNNRDSADWQPQEVSKLGESPPDDKSALSAFKIGLTKFEKSAGLRAKTSSPTESPIEKQLLRERGIDVDVEMGEEEEEGYDFGSGVTVNSKNMSSPTVDRHNVSNVSVSSGENSEDSGLVGESGEYGRRDSESRPPLPDTPMPRSASPQKLTYITEIKVSTSRENLREGLEDQGESSPKKEVAGQKPPRSEVTVTSNGKTSSGKKPPVPPRRNDASKIIAKETEPADKQVVYVSEYKSAGGKERIESSEKVAGTPGDKQNKKFEHWIFLGDNKEQNPWGNGSSQPQPVTNIVVSPGDDKKNVHQ